jgi:phosphotransferase system HPr (HPr) family protein
MMKGQFFPLCSKTRSPLDQKEVEGVIGSAEGSMKAEKHIRFEGDLGMHARPAAELVNLCQLYGGDVQLRIGDKEADGRSILSILSLGIRKGEEVLIVAQGPNAPSVVDEVAALLRNRSNDTPNDE